MEPIVAATTFATIVGLLGQFKAERRASEKCTIDDYVNWLQAHRHEQLVHLIQSNTALSHSIEAIVAEQHDEVMDRLRDLDQLLTDVASHIAGFGPLAEALAVESRLSEQAVSILHQLNLAEASQFLEVRSSGGTEYLIFAGKQREIRVEEARFILDDLETLCRLGLLLAEHGRKGDRIFTITRTGAQVGG